MLAVVLSSSASEFTVKLFLISAQSYYSIKLKENNINAFKQKLSTKPNTSLPVAVYDAQTSTFHW